MQEDPSNSQTDEEIAARVQRGDGEQFGVLMARYEPRLMRYGSKFLPNGADIQDIVQEVFISAYRNIRSFDPSQRFSPWIYRIAHNALVNALKKRSRNPLVFFDLDTLVSHAAYEDPRAEHERAELADLVEDGLEKISPKYKEVLILYYFEEMEYKEIADILRIPAGTVGIRLRRGKEALKKHYEKNNFTYGK